MTTIFPDRNISPKYFQFIQPGELLVRTMFCTIQGEGPMAGRPAVFLRLGGCNLGAKGVGAAGCEWCDTDFRVEHSQWLSFQQIQDQASEMRRNYGAPRDGMLWVITGGEPMLQENLVEFIKWTEWQVQIETNGMYDLPIPKKATVVVSPKLGGAKKYPLLKSTVWGMADCLKFVLDSDPDSPYHQIADYAFHFPRPVYVSPLAVYNREMTPDEGEVVSAWDDTLVNREATARNYKYAADYALTNGLRLSIQQHLFCSLA